MCRPTPKTNFTKCLPIIILFFTALRILAGLRIPYMILADQRYDDRMLFENAYDLLSGVWLGSYDAYALAKGIGYPMFLVLAKKLCLPYSVLLALLQAVGAWLFVRALSVRWKNPYGQTLLYLLLLFSPISLTQLVTQRLYRMAIVPGMVLFVFSGMIGLTLRKEKAASLGSSDRHGSCLFLADPRGFRLDPAVYRCHDSMECRLCDTGTA